MVNRRDSLMRDKRRETRDMKWEMGEGRQETGDGRQETVDEGRGMGDGIHYFIIVSFYMIKSMINAFKP